ncbi:MAG: hypothetical protein Q9175_001138 [Cornicularia normoerica]
MSGIEVVAVLACVAAVVSAYKDGAQIVKQIKAKRAAKKALAPTQSLESSLERGPIAVEQAKDNGIERYGSKFATGDKVATEALRNILINLQGTLLRHLWSAQEDDSVRDFHILVDASDFGRIQSVTVLNELYMRMAQAAPLHQMQMPIRELTTDSGTIWEYEDPTDAAPSHQIACQVSTKSPPVPTLSHQSLPLEDPVSKKDSGRLPDFTWRKWGPFPSRTRKHELETTSENLTSTNIHELALNGSLLGIQVGGNVFSAENSSPRVTSERSISPGGLAEDAIASSLWKVSSALSIDEENPWREEISTSNRGVKSAASSKMSPETKTNTYMPRRQSTETTLVKGPLRPSREPKPMRRIAPYKPRKQLVSESVPVAESGTPPESKGTPNKFPFMPRRRTTPPPQTHNLDPSISSIISRTPTNQSALQGFRNPYGGYCKGAYKLQVGLDKESANLRNQSVSMTGQSNYWACASSKCAFEGPACKNGKNWTFDDTIRVSNAVQYRWTFLAKCHVALSRVKNGQYDYQCVFCGVQPPENHVYRGEKAFIEHISQQHRGQQPDPSVWDKICCIYGRVALEEESFDINFLAPREDSPLVHRQVSVDTPDFITASPNHNTTPYGFLEWSAIEHSSSTTQRE